MGELDSAGKAPPETPERDGFFEEKLFAWKLHPNRLGFAADLVGAAVTLGKFEESDDAARFILSSKSGASPAIREVASRILGVADEPLPKERQPPPSQRASLVATIQLARLKLREDPRNALAWTDLALGYTSLGEDKKAKRAMRLALSLAESNRFIIRSASRLLIHTRNADEAYDNLKRNAATQSDPWLVATEIAAADLNGRTSRLVKRGREFLTSGKFAPFHLAELGGALASMELKAGNKKTARKLFQNMLMKPTENALAQAEWATERLSGLIIPQTQFDLPLSHEARARYSQANADWKTAVYECVRWLSDEPFSSRPAELGSFIAAEHLEDYALCEQICKDGLVASSGDGTLLNNLAFALANQGKLKEAQEALNRAMRSAPPGATKICCDATQGLIYFRTGEPEKGRERYEAAMSGASKARLVSIQIRGALHLALEELKVEPERALQPTRIALSLAKPSRDPELKNLLQRLHDILAKQAHRNGEIDAMLTELSELIKPLKSLPIVKTTFVPLM